MGYVGDELLYYNFGIIINFVGFRVMGYVGPYLIFVQMVNLERVVWCTFHLLPETILIAA